MEVGSAYSTVSLSTGPSGEEELDPLETIGEEDQGYERSEDRVALEPALDRLPDREREILRMRFEEGLPQTQIAAGGGPVADARLAPHPQVARRDARGAHLRAALRRTARTASPILLALALGGCPGRRRAARAARSRAGARRWRSAGRRWCSTRRWSDPRAPSRSGPSTRRRSPTGAPRAATARRWCPAWPSACRAPRATGAPTRCGCGTACTSPNGRPVRASDVEHSILRARALGPVGRRLFAGVAQHLERRREADGRGSCCGAPTRRSRTRWPRCRPGVVPASTPMRATRTPARRRASARIASSRRGPGARFVLTRNRDFSLPGVPGGRLDEIVVDVGRQPRRADRRRGRRHGST